MHGFIPTKITDKIFQNGYITENEAVQLRDCGVTHIINLDLPYTATRVDGIYRHGFHINEILVHDKAPLTNDLARRVIAAMQRAVDLEKGIVYVHCNAGLSRSPTAVWLYLVSMGYSAESASDIISNAAAHLSAPDHILVGHLDIEDLKNWVHSPRWELWLCSDRNYRSLEAVFPNRELAEAEKLTRESKVREFNSRGLQIQVEFWVDEIRPQ